MIFDDDFPGAPRILFIGWPNSPHTHSWIDLLQGEKLNVRLFGLPTVPPADWPVKTYMTTWLPGQNRATRHFMGATEALRMWTRFTEKFGNGFLRRWHRHENSILAAPLKKVIDSWRPHVIHTLGFDPAAYIFLSIRQQLKWKKAQWVAQARGGPDLYLFRFRDDLRPLMESVVKICNRFIADNQWNYDFAADLGLREEQKTAFGIVSGTGGMDIECFSTGADTPPSRRRRIIYMPKCYDNMAVRGHSALEGLRLAWPYIQPCQVKLSWITQSEFRPWVKACLGEDILQHCILHEKILPKEESIQAMREARVLYAPSVLDGIPNSMLEAMACGAFPIVSPLEGVAGVVEQEKNVLFARNLYPEELATALIRAMTEDGLVDKAAVQNRIRVRELADRNRVRAIARQFYPELASLGGWT